MSKIVPSCKIKVVLIVWRPIRRWQSSSRMKMLASLWLIRMEINKKESGKKFVEEWTFQHLETPKSSLRTDYSTLKPLKSQKSATLHFPTTIPSSHNKNTQTTITASCSTPNQSSHKTSEISSNPNSTTKAYPSFSREISFLRKKSTQAGLSRNQ